MSSNDRKPLITSKDDEVGWQRDCGMCVCVCVFESSKGKYIFIVYIYMYNKSQQIINSVILRICALKVTFAPNFGKKISSNFYYLSLLFQ